MCQPPNCFPVWEEKLVAGSWISFWSLSIRKTGAEMEFLKTALPGKKMGQIIIFALTAHHAGNLKCKGEECNLCKSLLLNVEYVRRCLCTG